MNVLLAEQQALNRATAGEWASYAPHRRRIASLLIEPARGGGRLCVLGAGNCNDLDLWGLAGVFDEIHLVDLDGEALAAALRRQRVISRRVIVHGGVDVAGGTDWAEGVAPFDTVLSAGLLTQLIASAVEGVPEEEESIEVGLAVRTAHLRLLVRLVRPGGCGGLVTELVSSDTFPELDGLPADRLGSAARQLIAERNFFTGTNPVVLTRALRDDPSVAWVRATGPWRWRIGAHRSYLAYGLIFGAAAA